MKKNHYLKQFLLVTFLGLFLACTSNSEEEDIIGLEIQNEDVFEGTILFEDHELSYSSRAASELEFNISIIIDAKVLNAQIDFSQEKIDFNGYNAVLSEEQKEVLLAAGSEIATYIFEKREEEVTMGEYSLLSMINYLAQSPENYVYSARVVLGSEGANLNLKSRNEGVSCIRKNSTVNAEYDDSRGSHSDRVVVGSTARKGYECMGRCGGGCGRWWIPSAWTKDCMDHDQCSNVNNSSGGSSDANCGDEFNEAADDYVFGVVRGCSG